MREGSNSTIRVATQPRGLVEVFSVEILDLIAKELSKWDLKHFRLVCKTLDELAQPLVFDCLVISFLRNKKVAMMGDLLYALESGTSPFVRWATQLRISELLPLTPPEGWYGERGQREPLISNEDYNFTKAMLPLQSRLMVPAIRSLKKITFAEYEADDREPYDEILCALAGLPDLQCLKLNLLENAPSKADFSAFSHLTEIMLVQLPLTVSVIQDLGSMIANCPTLTGLLLYVFDDGYHPRTLHFVDFIQQALNLSTFRPSLKFLRILGVNLVLSVPCAPFLHSLTRLELANRLEEVPSFWEALVSSQVYLHALRVHRLTDPIVQYILSYDRLREFLFDHFDNFDPDRNHSEGLADEEEIRLLYYSILPRHRKTLRTLGVTCNPGDTQRRGSWWITPEHLGQITLCSALEHLEFIYYHFDPQDMGHHMAPTTKPRFPLDAVLSTIASTLFYLHELKIHLDCRPHNHGTPDVHPYLNQPWKRPDPVADSICLASVCSTTFQTVPPVIDSDDPSTQLQQSLPQFRVRAVWKVLRPRCVYTSSDESWFYLEVEGDDSDDFEAGSQKCKKCGAPATSYSMVASWNWDSLLV